MQTIPQEKLFATTFTAKEVITKAAPVLNVDEYSIIGEYTVKADEAIGLGRGGYDAQSTAIGRIFVDLQTAAGIDILDGKFRISIVSSQDMPLTGKPVVLDVDLAALKMGETNGQDRFVFPFQGLMLGQDRKIVFSVKNTSAAAVTVDPTKGSVHMDMTRAML